MLPSFCFVWSEDGTFSSLCGGKKAVHYVSKHFFDLVKQFGLQWLVSRPHSKHFPVVAMPLSCVVLVGR